MQEVRELVQAHEKYMARLEKEQRIAARKRRDEESQLHKSFLKLKKSLSR